MNDKLIKSLIGKNNLEEAINEMLKESEGTHLHNSVLQQANRLKALQASKTKGTTSSENQQITQNQIVDALISILDNTFLDGHSDLKESKKDQSKRKKWKLGLGILAGFLVIIMIISIMTGGTVKNIFSSQENPKVISVTVFVHGKLGKHDLVLRQEGHVLMDVEGGERKRELIDDKGSATFKNVSVGDLVRIDVDFSEPYKSLSPDSIFQVPTEGGIYLAVGLQNLGKVFGTVIWDDLPLEGVEVSIGDLVDTTDSKGSYLIKIPEENQRQTQEVKFIKSGFKMSTKKAFPQTNQPLNVIMNR